MKLFCGRWQNNEKIYAFMFPYFRYPKIWFQVPDPSLIIKWQFLKRKQNMLLLVFYSFIYRKLYTDLFKKEIIFPRIHIKIFGVLGSKLIKNHLISGVSKLFSNPWIPLAIQLWCKMVFPITNDAFTNKLVLITGRHFRFFIDKSLKKHIAY